MPKAPPDRIVLLRLIDEAFDKKAWHGPNLRGAIRRVTPQQAAWQPGPGRHNIAEIVVHCAYWKYAVRRKLLGDKRGSFPLKGSNWFVLPEQVTDELWHGYVRLLDEQHAALREAVATAPLQLPITATMPANSLACRTYAIAMHDVYHAGQVQTIKALSKSAVAVT